MISGKKKIMHVMRFTRKQWKHGSTTQYIHTIETQRNVTDQFVDTNRYDSITFSKC